MSRRTRLAVCCAAALALLTGCNNARYVTVNSQGGVVAIPDNSNHWPDYNRRHAEELMQAKCPGGYVIDREEEVVVGTHQYTDTTSEKKGDPLLAALQVAPMREDVHEHTSSTNVTEWRITYHKADAPK